MSNECPPLSLSDLLAGLIYEIFQDAEIPNYAILLIPEMVDALIA
jgi:hypothetical protein